MTVFGNDHAALPFLQRVYPFDHLEAIWLSKSSRAQGKLRIIVDMTLRGEDPLLGKWEHQYFTILEEQNEAVLRFHKCGKSTFVNVFLPNEIA